MGAKLRKVLHGNVSQPQRWMRVDYSYRSERDAWENGIDGVYNNGVASGDGDGTVPLVSLGYMCQHGWKDLPEFNPAGVSIYTKEVEHDPAVIDFVRGGPTTARHLDIIGNYELISDMM